MVGYEFADLGMTAVSRMRTIAVNVVDRQGVMAVVELIRTPIAPNSGGNSFRETGVAATDTRRRALLLLGNENQPLARQLRPLRATTGRPVC